jgi:hypothetical protein
MKKLLCLAVGLAVCCSGVYAMEEEHDAPTKKVMSKKVMDKKMSMKERLMHLKDSAKEKLDKGEGLIPEKAKAKIEAMRADMDKKHAEQEAALKAHQEQMDGLLKKIDSEIGDVKLKQPKQALRAIQHYLEAQHDFMTKMCEKVKARREARKAKFKELGKKFAGKHHDDEK